MKNKIILKNKKEIEKIVETGVKTGVINSAYYAHYILRGSKEEKEYYKYYEQLINYKHKIKKYEERQKNFKIAYISDLHLDHPKKKSKNIVKNNSKQIAKQLKKYNIDILLIAGDTSADIDTFKNFISCLEKEVDVYKTKIVFVLGNHDLWSFKNINFSKISNDYKCLIEEKSGMYLVQNNLLYINDDSDYFREISYTKLLKLSKNELKEKLKNSKLIIFGGLAFSGYNTEFNANNGIYRGVISRSQEQKETQKFEKIYNKICEISQNKNTIILTHTPLKDWYRNNEYKEKFIYVSGHTHEPYFYDDGNKRVFSDNQIGYIKNRINLKYFNVDKKTDYFASYKDGIYKINREDYICFYNNKTMDNISYNKNGIIYMLKKNGYYFFIYESKDKSLSLLFKGCIVKKLSSDKKLSYYFDNMDKVINLLQNPINKYFNFQKNISNKVKEFGGLGHIHGSIIDIDFYNHIFVNPIDYSITYYWATTMKNKKIYPNIKSLLKENDRYNRYNKKGIEKEITIYNNKDIDNFKPYLYPSTDIYKVSKEIDRMKYLNCNILDSWYEPKAKQIENKKMLNIK